MPEHITDFVGLAATVLAGFEPTVKAQASSARQDGEQGADDTESTIQVVLSEGNDETVARVSVIRTSE